MVHYATDGVSESVLGIESFTRTYTYTLVTDAAGRLLRGAWTGASVDDHPDFAWLPTYNRTTAEAGENPALVFGEVVELLPAVHASTSGRALDAVANGVRASSRRASDRTTTWTRPIATPPDVTLGARVSGQPIARVVYFEQRVDASGATPTVTRDALVRLGESATAPAFEVAARLAPGKRMVLAYGHDASGRLLAVDEVTLDVGGQAPTPSADDPFEENDSAAAAAALAPGRYPDLACEDDDWFAVRLTAPGSLSVKVDLRHADGDLDLEVQGVGASTSTSDQEELEGTHLAAGVYRVRVHGYQGARGRYTLTVAAGGGAPASSDDRLEENDSRAAAAPLTPGAYPGLRCEDEDWFRVTLAATSTLAVKLDFRHAEGDLDLEVTDGAGAVLETSLSAADGEDVTLAGLAAGTYHVRVHGYDGARAAYGLTLAVTPAAGPAPTRTGTVTASVLNVRRGPGTSFGIVTTVRRDAVVTILEERAGWCRVTWAGAPSGELWVSGTYVRR